MKMIRPGAAASTVNLSSLRTTLAYHEDFHKGLAVALADRSVKAELRRCPLLSLPNNKLIPDARWILDTVGQRNIVARRLLDLGSVLSDCLADCASRNGRSLHSFAGPVLE